MLQLVPAALLPAHAARPGGLRTGAGGLCPAGSSLLPAGTTISAGPRLLPSSFSVSAVSARAAAWQLESQLQRGSGAAGWRLLLQLIEKFLPVIELIPVPQFGVAA